MRNPHLGDWDTSILWLNKLLAADNVFIMRTLTRGAKHWIIVYGYNEANDQYLVADPWLGNITYSRKQIESIWVPRDCDGFMVFK